jgi:phosphonate transport system substrate-binding protein
MDNMKDNQGHGERERKLKGLILRIVLIRFGGMNRWIIFICILMIGWGIVGCKKSEDVERKGEWRIALKADKNPEAMLEVRQALEVALGQLSGRAVKVIVPTSAAVILESLANGTLDAGYISGLEYLQGKKQKVVEGLLVNEVKGKTYYESCWVVRADADYKSVDDLRGKAICFASRTSTSGYLVPLADLVSSGRLRRGGAPEEYFGVGNVMYGTGYVSAIERLLNKQVEAAAVSDYVMDEDKHLSVEQKAKLRVLTRQGSVPTHVLAVRAIMAAEEKSQLKAALLSLNEEPWVNLRDRAFTAKWVEVDMDSHVKGLEDALDKIGFNW